MDYRRFLEKLRGDELQKAYVFAGTEEFLKEEALDELVRACTVPGSREFDFTFLRGPGVSPAEIVTVCRVPPLLSPRRVVAVKDRELAPTEELAAQVRRLPDCVCLILWPADTPVRRMTAWGRVAELVDFAGLRRREMETWVNRRASRAGVKISPDACRVLAVRVHSDLRSLAAELDKLACYVGVGNRIGTQDVEALVSPGAAEDLVFRLTDAIADRKASEAIRLFNMLVRRGEPPVMVLFMTAKHVRRIIQAKSLCESGLSPDAVAAEMGVHPYVAEKSCLQAANFAAADLLAALDVLSRADVRIKTGETDAATEVEMALLGLIGALPPGPA